MDERRNTGARRTDGDRERKLQGEEFTFFVVFEVRTNIGHETKREGKERGTDRR